MRNIRMKRLFNGIIFCIIVCCPPTNNQYISEARGESNFEPELVAELTTEELEYERFSDANTIENSLDLTTTPPYNFASCFPEDECFDNETTSQIKIRGSRNCMCDQKCAQYKDCCTTSVYYKKEEQTYMEPLPYTCLQYPVINGYASLLVRSSCSSSWIRAEISEKCSLATRSILDLSNLDVTIPVISYSTNISYANAYCALCNFEENYQYLEVSIKCSRYISNEPPPPPPPTTLPFTFKDTEYTTESMTEYRTWSMVEYTTRSMDEHTLWPTVDYTTSPRTYYETEDIINYYSSNGQLPDTCSPCLSISEGIPLDFCTPYMDPISSCPTEWSDQETIELCKNFYSLVISGRMAFYRNKYCAYCNGIPNEEIFCSYKSLYEHGRLAPLPPAPPAPPGRSLIILFAYRRLNNEQLCNGNVSNSDIAVLKVKSNFCPQIENSTVTLRPEIAVSDWFFAWYTEVALLLSIFFLILYLVMFFFVNELQNFGGKNLASLCVALILAYGSFLIGNFAEGTFCIVLGVLTYYSFLVAFACMLTMSYDLWRTFWNTKRRLRLSERQNTRFVAYSLWNWLIPVVPVSFALYVQLSSTQSKYSPCFGHKDCWFNSSTSLLFFFALPAFLMILVNFSFFAHALYLIQTNRCQSASKKSRVDFKLYSRLALLTGLTWVTGFIAGCVEEDWIWAVFVFLNTSQGIFIFAAFACKRRILALFLGRMGFSGKITARLKKVSTAQTSSETNTMLNLTNVSSATSVE